MTTVVKCHMVSRADIIDARRRLDGRIRQTPILTIEPEAFEIDVPVILKLENFQVTGSFKARGVFNSILAAVERKEITRSGIVTASGGNAAVAVAHAASALGIHASVYVPSSASAAKVNKLESLGADVVITGDEFATAFEVAQKAAAEVDAYFVHPYDQQDVIAGQGTAAMELAEQALGLFDTVLVAVGGGGLLAGTRIALDSHVRVVAVEPENCPTLNAALLAGHPTEVDVGGLTVDSLGARTAGDLTFEIARRHRTPSLLVSEESIIKARETIWDSCQMMVEYAAAVPIAALMTGAYVPEQGERLAVVICGANTDPPFLNAEPKATRWLG